MTRIEKVLAPLASLKVQERYIIGGTKDEYLVPEDLLNSAISALENGDVTSELSAVRKALAACNIPDGIAAARLVNEHAPWLSLRGAAKSYLLSTGFNLEQWEAHEL